MTNENGRHFSLSFIKRENKKRETLGMKEKKKKEVVNFALEDINYV